MRFRGFAAAALAFGFSWAHAGGAQGLGAVGVAGTCPSDVLLRAALARRSLPESAREYSLVVRGATGGARLSLSHAHAAVVVERELASDDCSALAEAASLIVEAYFVELSERASAEPAAMPPVTPSPTISAEGAPPPATPSAGRRTASEPAPPPAGPALVAPAPTRSAPAALPATAPAVTLPPSASASTLPANAQATAGTPHFTLALGAGADWLPESNAWSAAFQAGAGVVLPRADLNLELHGVLGTTTALGDAQDRVRRSESRLAARVGRPIGAGPLVIPWAGLGAAMARLELEGLPDAAPRVKWSPLLEAGLSVAEPFSRAWSLGAELGCRLLFMRERYRVEPDGPIGNGPRVGCSALGWVSWGSGTVP